MKNKKAMSISIVLLVLATLILCSFALVTFYLREKSINEGIYTTKFLEDIYSKEEIINFYINEIMENASESSKDGAELIDNFRKRLEDYKLIMPELAQIESQIDEQVEYDKENNKATAEFTISLEDKVLEEKSKKELFSAVYTYKKRFEKEI